MESMSNQSGVVIQNTADSATIEVFEAIRQVQPLYNYSLSLVEIGTSIDPGDDELVPAVYAPAGFILWEN
jgi:hypothetical protein